MATQAVEFSHFTITVTKGADVEDVVLGTLGGTIISVTITKIKETTDTITYHIIIIHDTVSTTALEYTTKQFVKTDGTDALDVVLDTVAGASQAAFASPTDIREDQTTYELIVVHLNA